MTDKRSPHAWIRPAIRALNAYHVPPATGMVKLDAMENPYRWPPAMIEGWLTLLRDVELNRYPDPGAASLKQKLRTAMQVPAESDIILGNGSDELIQMILMAMADRNHVVLTPTPGFVMYEMIATFCNMPFVGVPLNADFSLNETAMLQAIEQHQPAAVFLAYPNNPTGNLFDDAVIQKIIERAPGLVVIDEAYHAFAGRSYMEQLSRFEHLVVMRTVSKMGLAGLRLGLLAGSKVWLDEFDKVRLPYNINVLTQASARFALQHATILKQQTDQIIRDREQLFTALQAFKGLQVFSSRANFILFRTPAGQAQRIFDELKAQRVLIKNLAKAGGLLTDCLRVTVGTPDENQQFLSALRAALAAIS